jgi:hypothetical protein
MDKPVFTKEDHKKFAVALLNLAWSMLDTKDRTKEDDDKMLNAAHVPFSLDGDWNTARV